jgi:hypothetical protein
MTDSAGGVVFGCRRDAVGPIQAKFSVCGANHAYLQVHPRAQFVGLRLPYRVTEQGKLLPPGPQAVPGREQAEVMRRK